MSLVDAALLQAQLPSGGKEYGVKHLWEWGTSLATRPGSYWRGDALVGTGFGFAFCISGHNENIWQKSYTQASLRKIVCNSCGFFFPCCCCSPLWHILAARVGTILPKHFDATLLRQQTSQIRGKQMCCYSSVLRCKKHSLLMCPWHIPDLESKLVRMKNNC